jgi:predicted GNAT family N-acyltransferase
MAEREAPPPAIYVRLARDDADLRAIMTIRHQVFVVEQGVTAIVDSDPQDRGADQVVALVDGQIVGIGRLAIYGNEGQIAWVAVLPGYRRLGVGRAVMECLIAQSDAAGVEILMLNAQTHARRFYRHLGFRPASEVFMMGGIEHQLMTRLTP